MGGPCNISARAVTTMQLPLTFFKSADFAAFNRFQQPTRYSKTVWSVGTLERKRRYSSSNLHGVRGSNMDARSQILLCRLWIQLETCNHHRFQTVGSQSKIACVNDAYEDTVPYTDACLSIPSAESPSTADFSHTYSNSFCIASAGCPPKSRSTPQSERSKGERPNAHPE